MASGWAHGQSYREDGSIIEADSPATIASSTAGNSELAAPSELTLPLRVRETPASLNTLMTPEEGRSPYKAADYASFDLWDRIRSGFFLPDVEHPLIREHEEWYASRPDYVQRTLERSRRYLYYIVEAAEKRGMPLEVAVLPIIESAYNPHAYSRAHASGIWQFIPSTGKNFGLEQNYWYDGRRDVLAATNAALDYLQYLYGLFNNWELALASYNWGEGAVSRAIARNRASGQPTDYWSLNMPAETRNYVPKLLAVRNIIRNPQRFGLTLVSVPNRPYFATVTTNQHIDVNLAAKLANVPLDEFKSLNPAHNRPVIAAKSGRSLLLPVEKAEVFAENLSNYNRPLMSWSTYTPKRGERLDKIAARHGISVARLKEINDLSGNSQTAGRALLVPSERDGLLARPQVVVADAVPAAPRADLASLPKLERQDVRPPEVKSEGEAKSTTVLADPAPLPIMDGAKIDDARPQSPRQSQLTHVVRRGDTVTSIAKQHGISVVELRQQNALRGNALKSGQKLTITKTTQPKLAESKRVEVTEKVAKADSQSPETKPAEAKAPSTAKAAVHKHTVVKGDSVYKLAKQYGLSVDQLRQQNGLKSDRLALGQELNVAPVAAKPDLAKRKPGKQTHYVVQRGDTVSSIARRFQVGTDEIHKWNNWPPRRPLVIGERVTLLLPNG